MVSSKSNKTRGVFFHTSIYGFGHLVARGLSFLLLPFYTHLISTKDFGIYSLIISVATIVSIFFHLGLQGSFIKYFTASKDLEEKKLIFSNLIFIITFVSIPITFLLILFAPYFSEIILHNREYHFSFTLGLISILFMTFSYYVSVVYVTLERSKRFVVNTIYSALLNFILNVVFIYNLKLGIDGIFIAQILSSIVLIILSRDVLTAYFEINLDSKWIKSILKFGYPFFFSSLFTALTEVFDRFLVDYFLGSEQVGIYHLGYRFGIFLNLFGLSFRSSWIPHYFNFITNLEEGKEIYLGKVFSKLLMISSVIIVTISLFADDVFRIDLDGVSLFNAGYLPAAKIIPFILFGYFFNLLMSFYSLGPYISGKSFHFLSSDLLCFLSNLILNIILIPIIGISGAAIATMIAFMIGSFYLYIISRKNVKISYEKNNLLILSFIMFGFIFLSLIFSNLLLDAIMFMIFILVTYRLKIIDLRSLSSLKI